MSRSKSANTTTFAAPTPTTKMSHQPVKLQPTAASRSQVLKTTTVGKPRRQHLLLMMTTTKLPITDSPLPAKKHLLFTNPTTNYTFRLAAALATGHWLATTAKTCTTIPLPASVRSANLPLRMVRSRRSRSREAATSTAQWFPARTVDLE